MKKDTFDKILIYIMEFLIVFLLIFSIFCCFYFGNSGHHMSDKDAEEIIMGTVVF